MRAGRHAVVAAPGPPGGAAPRRPGLLLVPPRGLGFGIRAAITALEQAEAETGAYDPDADPQLERMTAAVRALRAAGLGDATFRAAKSLFQDPIQPETSGVPRVVL
ncbi:hypothetical protein [Polymorphospora sp. NPDC050346]|uniref:hypothetical protein n=1 Tax=Polymorphospora sp. NPDC050346 TaxID=3155780 RepID=UPI0033E9323C